MPEPAIGRVDLHAASGFGILHGLAGSSHYLGILPALGFADAISACAYLTAFGVASIATMTACASLLGVASKRIWLQRVIVPLASISAVTVGLLWLGGALS